MTHILGASNAMRKIAPLHRATLVEVDEASAPEGGKFIPGSEEWTQGRGPIPKVPRNRKPVLTLEQEFPLMWVLYGVAILLTVAGCSFLTWVRS